ncbi:hypothetical protein ACHJYY_001783 [Campylobacter jejuni]
MARIYKKLEAKKEEKQSNTTNVDKADNKKDKFFRYICLILKQSFIYKEDWSKFLFKLRILRCDAEFNVVIL